MFCTPPLKAISSGVCPPLSLIPLSAPASNNVRIALAQNSTYQETKMFDVYTRKNAQAVLNLSVDRLEHG